jgi:hypothetical protein
VLLNRVLNYLLELYLRLRTEKDVMRLGEPPSYDEPIDRRLHYAAGEGDLKCVQVLISEGLPINALD